MSKSDSRFGKPLAPEMFSEADKTRFWSKVNKAAGAGCWEWTASKDGKYGRFKVRDIYFFAHRLAYAFERPIASGMTIDHLCCNPVCVNPAHLEVVTIKENSQRHTRKITHCPQGHEYNEANTYLRNGHRYCRKCVSSRSRQPAPSADARSQTGEGVELLEMTRQRDSLETQLNEEITSRIEWMEIAQRRADKLAALEDKYTDLLCKHEDLCCKPAAQAPRTAEDRAEVVENLNGLLDAILCNEDFTLDDADNPITDAISLLTQPAVAQTEAGNDMTARESNDSARLDWLARHDQAELNTSGFRLKLYCYGSNFRNCIDEAMRAEPNAGYDHP